MREMIDTNTLQYYRSNLALYSAWEWSLDFPNSIGYKLNTYIESHTLHALPLQTMNYNFEKLEMKRNGFNGNFRLQNS